MAVPVGRVSPVVIAISFLAAAASAQPAMSPDAADSAASQRLAICEADANALAIAGDARKSYLSTCLSRRVGEANTDAAREKLKSCTAQGDEKKLVDAARKAFIENCVKGFVL